MAFSSDVASTGGYTKKKRKRKNPNVHLAPAPKRPVTSRAKPKTSRRIQAPASQPVSEHAMVSKARRERQRRSNTRVRTSSRGGKAWAASVTNFIPQELRVKGKRHTAKLDPGEAWALDVLKNGNVPLTNIDGIKKPFRRLATRDERRRLASARSAKNVRLGVLADLRPTRGNKYVKIGDFPKNRYPGVTPYNEKNLVQSVGGLPKDEHYAKRLMHIDKQVNSGKMDFRAGMAAKQQVQTDRMADYSALAKSGLTETGGTGKPSEFMRDLGEFVQAGLSSPFGLINMIRHPKLITKIPGAVWGDIKHPLRNPFFTAMDIWGVASLGAGLGGRVATSAGRLATGQGVRAAGSALTHRAFVPKSGVHEIRMKVGSGKKLGKHDQAVIDYTENLIAEAEKHPPRKKLPEDFGPAGVTGRKAKTYGAYAKELRGQLDEMQQGVRYATTTKPSSRNALVNIYRRANPTVTKRAFVRQLKANARVDRDISRGVRDMILKRGENLTTAEQFAVHIVEREQLHPLEYAEALRNRAAKIKSKSPASLAKKGRFLSLAKDFEEAANHVTVKNGRLALKGNLAELSKYISRGLEGRERVLTEYGLVDAKRMERRIEMPRKALEEELGRPPKRWGEPAYTPHGIDSNSGLAGFVRSVGHSIGMYKALPTSARKPLTFALYRSGLLTSQGTKLIAQRMAETAKIEDWAMVRDHLWETAITPAEFHRLGHHRDDYVVLMPKGALSAKDKHALAGLMREGKGDQAVDLLHGQMFQKATMEMLRRRGVRLVPREVAEGLSPKAHYGWTHTKGAKLWDAINHSAVGAMLYLGSKYVISNLPGQAWLGITSGAINPINLQRAVALQHEMSQGRSVKRLGITRGKGTAPDVMAKVGSATGGGISHSLTNSKFGPFAKISSVYGKIIDDPFRWATFVYHARRMGYGNAERLRHLMESNDPAVKAHARAIIQDTNRDMIDYENMGILETDLVRRVFLFYPWLKGSTLYTGRWLREHPIQSTAQIQSGRDAAKLRNKLLGKAPDFMSGVIPLEGLIPGVKGHMNVPGLGKVPRIIDPTAASIITQPFQIGADALASAKGDPRFGSYLGPTVGMGAAAALGWSPGRNEKISGDVKERMIKFWTDELPIVKNITEGRFDFTKGGERDISRLYPRTAAEDLGRSHLWGGFQPSPVNPKIQKEYFEKQQRTYRTKRENTNVDFIQWVKKINKAMGGFNKWSPDAKQALQLRYDRITAREGLSSRDSLGKIKADVDVAIKYRLIDPSRKKYYYDRIDKATDKQLSSFSNYLDSLFGTQILSKYAHASKQNIISLR